MQSAARRGDRGLQHDAPRDDGGSPRARQQRPAIAAQRRAYAPAREAVLQAAKPIAELKARRAARAQELDAAIAKTGQPADTLKYLPLHGRKEFWTALIDGKTAQPLAYLPLDPY